MNGGYSFNFIIKSTFAYFAGRSIIKSIDSYFIFAIYFYVKEKEWVLWGEWAFVVKKIINFALTKQCRKARDSSRWIK